MLYDAVCDNLLAIANSLFLFLYLICALPSFVSIRFIKRSCWNPRLVLPFLSSLQWSLYTGSERVITYIQNMS